MKKRLLLLPLLAGFALSSCSFEDLMFWKKKAEQETEQKEDEKKEDEKSVTSVKINGSKSTMTIGEELTLTATVTASEGLSKKVDWSSSNTSVATVTAGGKVTAKAEGTVTITAKSQADPTKSDSVSITVVYNGLHPELLEEGYTYTKTFPSAEAKAFAGVDVASFEASEGFYFLNSPAVAPTETEEGSLATFSVVFEPTDDNFDAIYDAYDSYCYFYDSKYDCECFIDPTQKVEVDFGVVELEDEDETELGVMNIYYVSDIWESSKDTTDTAWEEETAAALAAFPVDLPFVTLGEAYDVYVYEDGTVEISDYCADFTKLDGYDDVLVENNFAEEYDEEAGYYYVKANGEFTNAVVTFGFSMYGNTITIQSGLREVDYFPAIPLGEYVEKTIGSKYSVPSFDVDGAKYTFEITNEEGEEEGEVGEEYVSINALNVAEGDCIAYVGSLVADQYVVDSEYSFEHVMGQSVAYLQKGKIIVIATIYYDARYATEAEVAAYSAYLEELSDEDYAALSEMEQTEIFINSLYIAFYGTYPVYLYDEAILGANLSIYGDENGIEEPGLYILDSSISLKPEGTYTIEPVFFEIDETTVTYTTSDAEVATVDENGVVTAVGLGTATITASIAETSYTDTLEVVVADIDPVFAGYLAEANEIFAEKGAKDPLVIPDLQATKYVEAGYDNDYNCYYFVADTDLTPKAYAEILKGLGFETELDEYEDAVAVNDTYYIDIYINYYEYLEVDIYLNTGSGGGGETTEDGYVLDFTKGTLGVSGGSDGYEYIAEKGSSQSEPATEGSSGAFGELRLYFDNTMTVSSETNMTSIEIHICDNSDHNKTGATLTADTGTVTETEYGFLWEGDAKEVNFTCVRVGDDKNFGKQVHITQMIIN